MANIRKMLPAEFKETAGLMMDLKLEQESQSRDTIATSVEKALVCATEVFVAEEEGRLVGVTLARATPIENWGVWGDLTWVYVRPECRRQGIGRWLAGTAFRCLVEEHKCKRVEVFVLFRNEAARRLYAGLGFQDKGWVLEGHGCEHDA